jgi:hypothetical protein
MLNIQCGRYLSLPQVCACSVFIQTLTKVLAGAEFVNQLPKSHCRLIKLPYLVQPPTRTTAGASTPARLVATFDGVYRVRTLTPVHSFRYSLVNFLDETSILYDRGQRGPGTSFSRSYDVRERGI